MTIFRGVKISEEGIALSKTFRDISIDHKAVREFTDYLKWESKEVPLPYYYLMAQRAQTVIMTDRQFTISVPGMIHLSNELEIVKPFNQNAPFDIIAKVEVEYKPEGSLIPQFEVTFYQNDEPVVLCKSTYLAKRKSKTSKTKKEKEKFIPFTDHDFINQWNIEKNAGRKYGKASGDINPIHTSGLFAKIVGFKGMIMQGWYGASRAVKECEEFYNFPCRYIKVDFKAPLYIPGKPTLSAIREGNSRIHFQLLQCDQVLAQGIIN